MSLILDALRKADHDRKVEDDAGSLDDIYRHESEPDTRKKSLVIRLAILAFVLLLGVLAFFILSQHEEPQKSSTKTTENTSTRSDKALAVSKTPQTLEPISTALEMAQKTTSTNTSSNDSLQESITPIATETNIKADEGIDVSSLRQTQIEQQYRTNTKEKTQPQADIIALYDTEKPEPIAPVNTKDNLTGSAEKPKEPDVETDKNSLARYRLTPYIKELLPSVQRDIPTMMYQNHQYVDGGRSSVTIGGKRLYEGNSPAQGVTIQRILKDGMIMKYNQTEFKMAAMNSWINF